MAVSRPLTDAQQAMIIDSMNSPGAGLWNVQLTFTIREALDVDRLKRCWQDVVDRHTSLRSRVTIKGEPTQHVDDAVEFEWEVVDWRGPSDETIEASMDPFRREMLLTDLDFETAPIQRVALVTCREDLHCCVWVGHHAFVDGRSMYNLALEVGSLYRGEELDPARPFADYLDWRHTYRPEGGEAHWKGLLGGFDKPTGLGWEDDGRPVGELGGTELSLSRADTQKLDAYCEQMDVTRNTLLQSAWAVLVHRYSGSDDVVFGSVRACRKSAIEGMDRMIGQFVNAVPVRVRMTPELTARALVEDVRRQHLEVRDFEHTSPLEIRAASDLPVGPRLFESVVAFEALSIPEALARGGKVGRWEVVDRGRNGYATTVFGYGGPEMLLRMEWHGGWLPGWIAGNVLPNLARTMLSMVEEPDTPVTKLDCLAPEERRRILEEWQGPEVEYPRGETLHGTIAAQAKRTPDAVAVHFESEQQTYRELMERVDAVAASLRARGVDRESRVGVCLPRCLDLPAVLVGVMKAGGAYVPLDPDDPPERIRFLVEDTKAKSVVTTRALAGDLELPHGGVTLLEDVDAGAPPVGGWPDVSDEEPAYVIFTSGSTGRPKGVINSHRGVINRLRWAQDTYALTPTDRVFQKTPFTFDVSVWELFWPLMTGARMVVAEPDGHKDMRYLADLIDEAGVTVVHFVPSVLREFLEEADTARCHTLRQVICSGEALPVDVHDDFLHRFDARLDNLYGPTEAAVDVSWWRCRVEPGQAIVPMGRPVANTQLRVLDRHMQLMPAGMAGELYIGGAQVALGYENREELTAERFLADPFQAGNRLYRTGDLVRYREDGALEFLGRMDDQVKVRGYRIELGEVEAALRGHPAIRDAAVLARAAPGEPTRLVAIVVYAGSDVPMASEIRRFLREWLPDHMIPGLFIDVGDFPRLSSGKIDRKALSAVAEDRMSHGRTPQAPLTTDAERAVADAWSRLLQVADVGAEDNFFELGGDSLLAMQVVLAIEDAVGYRLDPRVMFFKNLRQIAVAVDEAVSASSTQGGKNPR